MAEISATDPSDLFKSWEAAWLAKKDLKPMEPADLKQAELIWRKYLAFCTVQAVDWDAAQSTGIARFCQTIGPRSSSQKNLARHAESPLSSSIFNLHRNKDLPPALMAPMSSVTSTARPLRSLTI